MADKQIDITEIGGNDEIVVSVPFVLGHSKRALKVAHIFGYWSVLFIEIQKRLGCLPPVWAKGPADAETRQIFASGFAEMAEKHIFASLEMAFGRNFGDSEEW